MSRSRKTAPEAGDAALTNTTFRETILNNNDAETTLSEPHETTHGAIVAPLTVQHRHSLPPVWNTEIYVGARARITEHSTHNVNMEEAVQTTPEANRHYNENFISLTESEQEETDRNIDNAIFPQNNNNMPVDFAVVSPKKSKVTFAQNASTFREAPHSRRTESTQPVKKFPENIESNEKDIEYFGGLGLPDGDNNETLKECRQNYSVPKSLSYRRAKLFCCFGSSVAIFLILIQICFLLASLLIRNTCKSVSGFIGRISFLSIIVICLEWMRYCLWRENVAQPHMLQTMGINDNSNVSLMGNAINAQNDIVNNFDESSKPSNTFSTQQIGFGNLNGGFDQEKPEISNRRYAQIENIIKCDGKRIAFALVLFIFYIILISMLIDGVIWIPRLYTNSMKLDGKEYSSITVNSSRNLSISISASCTPPSIYAGLVFLYMTVGFFAIRLFTVCIFRCCDTMRCCIFFFQRRRNLEHRQNGLPDINFGRTGVAETSQLYEA